MSHELNSRNPPFTINNLQKLTQASTPHPCYPNAR